MKKLLIIGLIFSSTLSASNNIKISAIVSDESTVLNNSQVGHVFGNVTGYLSTCIRYERVVGQPYDLQKELMALEGIKAKNHLLIGVSNKSLIMPIRKENIKVDEIAIGFSENHLPILMTIADGKPQSYSKCMGNLSIKNFKCDDLIAKLFKFDQQHPFCKNESNEASQEYNMSIRASLSTAGPYGDFWEIEINEFLDQSGGLAIFSKSSRMATGDFKGETIINKTRIQQLNSTIKNFAFKTLPKSISPKLVGFHQPRYLIEICEKSICHKVELYDPANLKDSMEKDRYSKIWYALIQVLPDWPKEWPDTL